MSFAFASQQLESIVVAATFTAEPLARPLRAWLKWLGIAGEIRFAPYNQLFQQVLDPHSLIGQHPRGTNIFLVRLADWAGSGGPEQAAKHAVEFGEACARWSQTVEGRVLVVCCPSCRDDDLVLIAQYESIEHILRQRLADGGRVLTVGSHEVRELYPTADVFDELANRAGHIPYSRGYFVALASCLVRRLSAVGRQPSKVIAVDCDDTLWDGVCGEVGPLGVVVSAQRLEFQRRLLELRDAGFLLCLCSKNNPDDAWRVFDEHPHMLLKRSHITAAQLNWEPKSQNLQWLSSQLKLGLDSFVFLDDNPLEIAEVRATAPQVLSLQLPGPSSGLASEPLTPAHFLQHIWPLDRWSRTAEDRQRAEQYSQEVRREEVRQQAPSLEQFLAQLELQLDYTTLSEGNLERAAQLTERTNQFNFTARRRTVSELQFILSNPTHHAFLVQARDRFGDYGLVGLVVFERQQSTLVVDTFLLSCRALGRRIEVQMLTELVRRAKELGADQIAWQFVATQKNQPAQDFAEAYLAQTAAVTSGPAGSPQERTYVLSLAELQTSLGRGPRQPTGQPRTDTQPNVGDAVVEQPSSLMQRIAGELNSVDLIERQLRATAFARPALNEAYAAPCTPIECRVAAICAETLHVDRVGLNDDLKSLGASSLHVVQIYSQLEQEYAAGLTVTNLFALPTVAAMVDRIVASRTCELANARQLQGDQQQTDSAIAIVGMAGRFPGAKSVAQFWGNVTQGVCSIVDIPDEQLNLPIDSPLRNNPNLVRRGASVADADQFDAQFFGIFPREATVMDPQHRLFLENCWHALEDAGYNPERLTQAVGVFAGCYMDTYILASLSTSPKWLESLANAFHGGDLLTELGNDKDYLATRVSFLLNLRGPAITVQTACSTSLVAIAQACQSLNSGQCHMALAGGSTLKLPQNRGYLYTEGGMVSPDGVCRTFDARARGTVFGEGCAVVLLKRLEDALADGDDIYAVIKGWGLNNDGRAKLGYTAPSVAGQAGAIEMAHRAAGVTADTITLVEAHGTGTSLGDPIEIEALTRVFRQTTDKKQYCAIGSVKTNIGHLDVAAGVTGLIKASLALRHRVLPPSLNFEQPNPNIDFPSSPFYVNTRLSPWEAPYPRRACISSFGVGGTNAHVVLEEAPELPATERQPGPQLITLSARSQSALETQRLQLIEHLRANPQLELADVAYTLQTGRKTFNYTLAAVARDSQRAVQILSDNNPQQVVYARQLRRGKSVVFMFPGQGAQHINMAGDLYADDPVFREHLKRCAELLGPHLGFDIRDRIFGPESEASAAALNQTSVAQGGVFSISYALAKRWEALGISPTCMLGHSVGEFVAACLSGVFSLEDALKLIAFRAQAMQRLPAGSMLAVRLSESELAWRLPTDVSIAAINGPQLCVLSGPTSRVESLRSQLEAEDVVCRPLHTSHAFHSAMMDEVVGPFAEQVQRVALHTPQIPIVSSVTGLPLTTAQALDPWYWARHLRETVRFTEAIAQVARDPDSVLVEVGPGQTLSTLARQHPLRDSAQAVVSTLPHAKQTSSAHEHLWLAVGRLWQAGVDVDSKLTTAGQRRRRVHLPGYPFERQRYWLEPDALQPEEHELETAQQQPSLGVAADVCPLEGATCARPTEPEQPAVRSDATTPEPESQAVTASATPGPPDLAANHVEELTRRVIQQQLQLMKQQLQAWSR